MIDWNQIESVFLDLDGTLLDLRFDNHFWVEFIPDHYAQHHGLVPNTAREGVLARMKELRGTLDWYCTDFWSRELDLDIIALKDTKRELIRTRPGAEDFLSTLHADRRRVILVTNAHPKTIDIKMLRTGIAPLFDRIISSHELGYPKEKDRFWELLQEIEPFFPRKPCLSTITWMCCGLRPPTGFHTCWPYQTRLHIGTGGHRGVPKPACLRGHPRVFSADS